MGLPTVGMSKMPDSLSVDQARDLIAKATVALVEIDLDLKDWRAALNTLSVQEWAARVEQARPW